MIWDIEALPLCITNINTTVLQLEKSGEEELMIKNVTRADLEQIKEALAFYHKVHFDLEGINKSVQASTDLILELVKDKKGIIEVVLNKFEQFKNSQQVEKEQDGLVRKFPKKV